MIIRLWTDANLIFLLNLMLLNNIISFSVTLLDALLVTLILIIMVETRIPIRSFEFSFLILIDLLVVIWLVIIIELLRLLETSKMLILLLEIGKLILIIILLWKASNFEFAIIIVDINVLCNVLHDTVMHRTRILKILIGVLALRLSLARVLHINHVLPIQML